MMTEACIESFHVCDILTLGVHSDAGSIEEPAGSGSGMEALHGIGWLGKEFGEAFWTFLWRCMASGGVTPTAF